MSSVAFSAQLAAMTRQRERSVELLRQAIAEGIPFNSTREGRTRAFGHTMPEFRTLRGYPPYEELLRPRD